MAVNLNEYLPLVQKYIAHWTSAEAELKGPLVLGDGSTMDTLRDLHESLASANTSCISAERAHLGAAQQRETARAHAIPVASQARKAILGRLPSSPEAAQLPARIPSLTTDAQKQLAALEQVQGVWTVVNVLPAHQYPGFTPPLVVRVIQDGATVAVTLAEFNVLYVTLGQAAEAVQDASVALKQATVARHAVVAQINAVLASYSKVIKGTFPPGSTVLLSLPKRS